MNSKITPELIYSIGFDYCKAILKNAPNQAETWIHFEYTDAIKTDAYYAVMNGRVYGFITNPELIIHPIENRFNSIEDMVLAWGISDNESFYVIDLKALSLVLSTMESHGDQAFEQFFYDTFEMTANQAKGLYGQKFIDQCENLQRVKSVDLSHMDVSEEVKNRFIDVCKKNQSFKLQRLG